MDEENKMTYRQTRLLRLQSRVKTNYMQSPAVVIKLTLTDLKTDCKYRAAQFNNIACITENILYYAKRHKP